MRLDAGECPQTTRRASNFSAGFFQGFRRRSRGGDAAAMVTRCDHKARRFFLITHDGETSDADMVHAKGSPQLGMNMERRAGRCRNDHQRTSPKAQAKECAQGGGNRYAF